MKKSSIPDPCFPMTTYLIKLAWVIVDLITNETSKLYAPFIDSRNQQLWVPRSEYEYVSLCYMCLYNSSLAISYVIKLLHLWVDFWWVHRQVGQYGQITAFLILSIFQLESALSKRLVYWAKRKHSYRRC